MDTRQVGERILLSRRRKMTQAELGKIVGLSQARVSEWERGEITVVDLVMLEQFARALHVSPEYLAGWVDDPLHNVVDEEDEEEAPLLREDSPDYSADPIVREILDLVDDMSGEQRKQLAGIARVMLGSGAIQPGAKD